ncbi:uncharacterized protein LOC123551182 [Mercenaria mercenaria]|uniref:uncharacterized protein LOC123551182 n=1 Tax=Mercenaria mercenaria TaxID=6596 RepID=UPI00234F978C|nr:uncharacterized protein LOC123551182 [Mercenaria mercenaria]
MLEYFVLSIFIHLSFGSCPIGRCNWFPWESWSSCSRTCSGGLQSRLRWICCESSLANDIDACLDNCRISHSTYVNDGREIAVCNPYCYNGGTFVQRGYCTCPDVYYGTCCEQLCPSIENCKRGYCTSSSNVNCHECFYDKTFYKRTYSDTKCERMCSWNSHYCWPGECSEELTRECTCARGFKRIRNTRETSCQPAKVPSILTCNSVAVGPKGEKKRALSNGNSTTCQYLTDMYGKFQLSLFEFVMAAEYTVDITGYTKPSFIMESNFGITDTTINVIKVSVRGARSTVSTHKQLTDTRHSEKTFQHQHDEGHISVASPSYNLLDGQALCLEFEALAGGYLKSKNLITHTVSAAVPYQKVRGTREICYRFDNTAPIHCKDIGKCNQDPVQLQSRITRSAVTSVSFNGWEDPEPSGGSSVHASSIESYQITVNEVPPSTGNLKVDYLTNVYTNKVEFDEKNMLLNLTSDKPRLYCITLEVKDKADNVRQARQFLLYDNTSFIETRESKPFKITSASIQTKFKWQTHHHDICLSWKDHFLNRYYLDNALLNPIEPAPHGLITGIYEQNSGVLPVSGTKNVNGIVKFMISWSLNGGHPTSEIVVPEFQNQSYCNDFDVKDGQTYTIAVRSIDIAGNTYKENRTVSIDRSVPHINNIWLRKDGYKTLFVHHETDLSTMQLYFEALDLHSGIRMVQWAFGITDPGTELSTGSISVVVPNEKSCPTNAVECYCPDAGVCEFFNYTVPLNKLVAVNKHEGDHNRNYYFTIKVTNHAHLYNIEHVDILVDDSPPEAGVVYEGPEHSNDIDYTSDETFLINWHGFTDHESGIKTYRIGLAARCLGQTELYNFTSIPDIEFYVDVPYTESSLRIPANFTGKRYISMVALNNAMSPSKAICSDGIKRDLSPPEIRNLTLEHGSWSETIVCHEGRAWLFHSSVSKILLHNVSSCIDICNESPQNHFLASALPTNNVQNIDSETSDFMCRRMRKYRNDTIIYLPTDHINLVWDVEENGSQVDDNFIGIGIDPSEVNSPSIHNYQSTAKRTSFTCRHEGIGSDELFFIFLKVVNKASIESVTVLGPVLIDETPPVCTSVPKVDVLEENILVGWANDTFYDIEQKELISSIYFEIGCDSMSVTPLLQWDLETSMPCPQFSGGCFKYPIRRLQIHDNDIGLPFYITMHVYNNAGHALTVTTDIFRIPSRYPPGHAIVTDSDPECRYKTEDTNVHFTSNTLCFKWTGFKHHESVKVEVGVGSNNSTDDIVPYSIHKRTENFHCIHSSNIKFQQTYFAFVKASCSGGVTMSASNGVTVLDKSMLMKSLTVRLGEKCSTTDVIMPVVRNLTHANLSVTFSAEVGKRYELFIPTNIIDSVYTNDGIIFTNMTDNFSLSIVPFIKNPVVYISSSGGVINEESQIHIHKCPSTLYVGENDIISAHWFYTENKDYGLIFEVAIVNAKNMTRNNSQIHLTQYESSTILTTHTFYDVNLEAKECYNVVVKQCSYTQCLEPVFSRMFCVASSSEARNLHVSSLKNVVGASCFLIKLEWSAFRSDSRVLFYQWVVSQDNAANHILIEWQTIRANDTEKYQVQSCIEIPVHLHSTMFGCVRALDEAGNEGFACQSISNGPKREYTPDTVYDFDSNSKAWKSIKMALPSADIGHLYTVLHNNELDFGTPETQVMGVMLYATERNVTWYLMLKNQAPGSCELNKYCIMSKTNNAGYVSFDQNLITLNTFYYVCAYSSVTVIEREVFSETLYEINSCSNGFVLDSKAPRSGRVEARNTNGFLTNLFSIELAWIGFVDEIHATKFGYVDSIRTYSYAIGSRPYADDIRNFTNVGLKRGVVINGIDLPDGSVIYFTVRATDHAGNSATSVSSEYIVDTSSPTRGRVQTQGSDMYHDKILYVTEDEIVVHLSGFKEEESGIDYFEIGLGSKPYLMDILSKTVYYDHVIALNLIGLRIIDGHIYYISAKAVNRAGLASEYATLELIADKSPPTGGHVLDGLWKDVKDDNYQTDLSHVNVHWKGFIDPHSGIAYYRVGLGTKAYLDDIEPFFEVGLVEDITWHTEFIIGHKYYTTVEACNGADLCVTRASDGIVIDNSPPIQGLVQTGSDDFHRKFQSHTSSVHVRWTGFDDPQSGIDHYDMCIGTKPGSCDILPDMNCLLQSNVIKTGLNLPPQTELYATVTAYNKVRLNVTQTSDSFYVDATPPVMSIKPNFVLENNNIAGKKGQWDKSVVKIYWKFDDDESPIAYHDVSLVTHHEGHTPVEHVQLRPVNEFTIHLDGKSWLHDGDTYFVIITSCNLAGLCSSARSVDLIIDSSPPHLGGFKSPMVWKNLNTSLGEWKSNITLSWYGFQD